MYEKGYIESLLSSINKTENDSLSNNALKVVSVPIPVNMPTYDGSGTEAHVNIIYIPGEFNGYKYWAIMTPYPGNSIVKENPSIVASNDLSTWVVPEGLTNPIVAEPEDGSHYSDVCLVLAGVTLMAYYRWSSADSNTIKTYVKTSTDGITWGNASECTLTGLSGGKYVSPQVILNGSTFEMYVVNESTLKIEKYTSANGTAFALLNALKTPNIKGAPWHITGLKDENGYHFIVSFNDADMLRNKLYYGYSPDGNIMAWDTRPLIMSEIDSPWEKSTYVGCLAPYNNSWKLFFTPVDDVNSGTTSYVCDVKFTGARQKLIGAFPVVYGQALTNTTTQSVDVSKIFQNYKTKAIHIINTHNVDVVVALYSALTNTTISDGYTVATGTHKVIHYLTAGTVSWGILNTLAPEILGVNLKYAAASAPASGAIYIFIQCEE